MHCLLACRVCKAVAQAAVGMHGAMQVQGCKRAAGLCNRAVDASTPPPASTHKRTLPLPSCTPHPAAAPLPQPACMHAAQPARLACWVRHAMSHRVRHLLSDGLADGQTNDVRPMTGGGGSTAFLD